jgi:Tfp pilus assembly pilus retraction ATPase PilT
LDREQQVDSKDLSHTLTNVCAEQSLCQREEEEAKTGLQSITSNDLAVASYLKEKKKKRLKTAKRRQILKLQLKAKYFLRLTE